MSPRRALALLFVGALAPTVLTLSGQVSAQAAATVGSDRPGDPAVQTTSRPPAHVHTDHVRTARGTHKWTTTNAVVPTTTGPGDDLPIDIDTTLFVPDNASRKHPQPAILMTHGFGLTKDSNEVVDTARFLAAHGYVVLTYTSAGFGGSGGCVSLQSADYDVKSASQLIDKVLDPRKDVLHDRKGVVVGTIGGSYGGGIQLPLAAADQQIRTSIVGRSWNNLSYSLDPNNRIVPGDRLGLDHGRNGQGVFKMQWTSLFYALGQTQPAMGGGGCEQAKLATGDPAEIAGAPTCPGYFQSLCDVYTMLAETGNADRAGKELIARASGSRFIGSVKNPVLLIQGQSDTLFNLNDATATYLTLKSRHVPVSMIWNSGGHGGYSSQPGECEVYDGAARSVNQLDHCYLSLRSLRWMDHYLRGTKGSPGPQFSFYRDWRRYAGQGPDDEQYAAADRFPLGRVTRFTLSGSDALALPGVRATRGSATMLNPAGGMPAAYSETSNFSGPDSSPSSAGVPASEQPGQFAAFTSTPVTRAVSAIGIPTAHLQITNTNGQDMVFFAKVYDVSPDGSASLIHRLIAPVRVPAAVVDKPVDLALAGFAHRFRRGHSIRLVLATTDQTSYNAKVADTLTVTTGSGSTFTLPGWVPRH